MKEILIHFWGQYCEQGEAYPKSGVHSVSQNTTLVVHICIIKVQFSWNVQNYMTHVKLKHFRHFINSLPTWEQEEKAISVFILSSLVSHGTSTEPTCIQSHEKSLTIYIKHEHNEILVACHKTSCSQALFTIHHSYKMKPHAFKKWVKMGDVLCMNVWSNHFPAFLNTETIVCHKLTK